LCVFGAHRRSVDESSDPDTNRGNAEAGEGGSRAMGRLLGAQATLIRRCHVVLMSAEAFANLISRGGGQAASDLTVVTTP